nr:site-specific DNA-methyltransferase [uncultured Anaerotignum sp.]
MNETIDGMSMNIEHINMEKLKSVFPECFTEGKLDIDKLLSLCGEYIDNDFEKYKFEWKGKAECLRLAQKRSTGTLRPCPEESVNWDTTKNLYIEGDNLEVLKLLQTAYYRKVKMIYIDPPYNTGNDFVYEDDFADPLARYKEVTQQTTKSNPETMGRYHTNWLNMMYPRLRLAANLLRDDGVIFISIDDNEVTNLRKICDEVFGEENFVNQFAWINNITGRQISGKGAVKTYEHIVVYAKNISEISEFFVDVNLAKQSMPDTYKGFKKEIRVDEYGEYAIGDTLYNHNRIFNEETRPNLVFSIFYNPDTKEITTGNIGERKDGYVELLPHKNGDGFHKYHAWRWSKQKIQNESHDLIILPTSNGGYEIYTKTRDFNKTLLKDTITNISNGDKEIKELFDGRKYFNYPKSTDLLKIILNSTQYNDDIILDFFSGSATTAHAVMQLNAEDGGSRQFIMVQLPEVCDEKSEAYKAGYQNICEIGKERIRRAGKKILEENNQMTLEDKEQLDIGFKVFKLDSSNLKTWDNTPVTAEQLDLLYERMNNMIHRVKSERSDLDMVCEIMLKLGVPLTYSITAVEINGKTAYSIGDDCLLLICLAPDVQPEDVEQMAEYAPAKLIISRESFVDDTAMANTHYILKDHGMELKLV